jgi:hypothetical protein
MNFGGRQFGDALAELRANPVQFESIGGSQTQNMLTLIVVKKDQRFDPSFE